MLRQFRTLYIREMRSSLRERQVVVFSIAVPVVLYPLLLWGMFSMMSLAEEREEGLRPRVAELVPPNGAEELPPRLREMERVRWAAPAADSAHAVAMLRDESLDAVMVPRPGPRYDILYSGTSEAGRTAMRRLRRAVGEIRLRELRTAALLSGVPPADWQIFAIETMDVSSRAEQGSFLLSLMLPVFFSVMVAVGSFYPAVDSTAGDRERRTWETLMSCGVSRSSILWAKYLSVATFGTLAGVLNVSSMTLSLSTVLAPLAGGAQLPSFSISPASLPLVVLASALLAGVLSAGMMILASFARTFREGQALVQPFYILAIMPALLLQLPGLRLDPLTALVPFLNTALLVRAAVQGSVSPFPSVLTLAVSAAAIVLMLRLASGISAQEGSAAGDIRLRAPSLLRSFIEKRSGKEDGHAGGHH
jgi:sodium transport system permease protein